MRADREQNVPGPCGASLLTKISTTVGSEVDGLIVARELARQPVPSFEPLASAEGTI